MRLNVDGHRRTAVAPLAAAVLVAVGWWGAGAPTSAQGGGKAVPVRIRFAAGHDSATVHGTLGGDAQREYVFGARGKQRVTIGLSATPRGTLSLAARRPAGVELPLQKDAAGKWSSILPEDGDYEIWLQRESRGAPASEMWIA